MRFRSEENATSDTRVVDRRRSATPNSRAARSSATSVGWPASSSALEQSDDASSAASTGWGRSASSPSSASHSRSPPAGTSTEHSQPPRGPRRRSHAPQRASVMTISFFVSVPVLSQQSTSVQPSASTAGSRFTTALWRAMRMTPSASVTATQIGRPSGIAATARDTPTVKTSRMGSPRSTPTRPMATMTAIDAALSFFPRLSMPCWSGVRPGSRSLSSWAAIPNSVRDPVQATTPRPRP